MDTMVFFGIRTCRWVLGTNIWKLAFPFNPFVFFVQLADKEVLSKLRVLGVVVFLGVMTFLTQWFSINWYLICCRKPGSSLSHDISHCRFPSKFQSRLAAQSRWFLWCHGNLRVPPRQPPPIFIRSYSWIMVIVLGFFLWGVSALRGGPFKCP